MKSAIEAIHERRSVRKFKDKSVKNEEIEQLLKAAMQAPSAGNGQPWHFIVIDDHELLSKIPSIHPYAYMAKDAPVGILVCGDLGVEKYPGYWVQDCSAAIENMLIAVSALGLGAVWTGIHPNREREDAFRKMFDLPDKVVPLAFVPIGHPAENRPAEDRFNKKRIHHNRW